MPLEPGLSCPALQGVVDALVAAGNAVVDHGPSRDGRRLILRDPIDADVVASCGAEPHVLLKDTGLWCECWEYVLGP